MSSIRWPSPTSWAAAPKAPRSTASSTAAGSSVTSVARVRCQSTVAARRARSTVSTAVSPTAARSTTWRAFAPASCNSSRSASAAQATWGPPRLLAPMPAPAPTSGAATAAVSTMGCGSAARPVSSNTSTRACSSSPSPPPGSGTQAASTPMSASRSHTPRSSAPAAASHAARTASGGHSLSSRSRTASRKASCSSSNPKNTPGPRLHPREAEHPLGGDVALDLVGAGVDRSRQRELRALQPGSLDLGAGPEQVEGDLVQLDVQLRPRGGHRHGPALADLAQDHAVGQRLVGHEGAVEEHLGEALVAVEPAEAPHRDARGVEGDEQVAEAPVALRLRIGAEQPEQVGAEGAPGGPGLLPVEDPAAVDPAGPAADGGQVAARVGLGPALAPQVLGRRHPGQDVGLLGGRPELEHRGGQQEDAVLGDAGRAAGPVVLLLEDEPLPERGAAAAELLGPRHRGPAAGVQVAFPVEVLGEARSRVAGGDVVLAAVGVLPGREVLGEPRPGLVTEGPLGVGPGQVHVGPGQACRRLRVAVASETMRSSSSPTVGSSSITPVTCPVGSTPTSGLPSTSAALMSMGALAAIATCDHDRPWFRRMASPSRTKSGTGVPVTRRKASAARRARGSRVSGVASSSRSTVSVRITRCGAPSSALVTTVSVTAASR